MALYNLYRPAELEDVVGNSGVVESLNTAVEDDNIPHTLLLSGPSGCGKTTIARILAATISTPDDIRELNISKTRGIDAARNIIDMCRFKPLRSKARVVVLNECHKATNEFQNAMLEILEEPPEHTYFFLCTTEPEKLIGTVRGRCAEYKVERLNRSDMESLLSYVIEEEEMEIPSRVIRRIIQDSNGSPRNALSSLETVASLEDEETMLDTLVNESALEDFDLPSACRLILRSGNWSDMAKKLKAFNGEPESVRRAMLGYFTAVLLNAKGSSGNRDVACFAIQCLSKNFFDSGKAGLVAALYEIMEMD